MDVDKEGMRNGNYSLLLCNVEYPRTKFSGDRRWEHQDVLLVATKRFF